MFQGVSYERLHLLFRKLLFQLIFACSKLTIEALEQGVKYAQS